MHANIKDIKKLFKSINVYFHHHPIVRFFIVFFVFLVYLFISMYTFGAKDGFFVSLLTWSFFVLCTPVADGGILLDLPIRLLTGLRMMYSEIIVWSIAISVNILFFFTNPALYQDTHLLGLFHNILAHPFPYWIIIILSGLGTFLSLLFGDELIDLSYGHKKERKHHAKHKHKYRFILLAGIFVIILFIYDYMLNTLGISIF